MKNILDKQFQHYICVLVFFVFSVLLMEPLSIYLPNSQELSFGLKDVLINVVLMAVVLSVIITVLYLCISEKFRKFWLNLPKPFFWVNYWTIS